MPGFKAPANYFGIFIPKGVPPEVIATVEKIWAEQIVNSAALKQYATSRGAQFAPYRRRRRAEGGVPRRAGQRLGRRRHRQGEGRAGHARHSASVVPIDVRVGGPRCAGPHRSDFAMTTEVYDSSPRHDLVGRLVWTALGCLIAVLSWQMDRMTQQGATLHTAPGLWPGIVGACLALAGRHAHAAVVAARAAHRLGRGRGRRHRLRADRRASRSRPAMFFVYALLLVGRGLPFWLGTALFVTRVRVPVPVRRAQGRKARRFAASSSRSPAACSRLPSSRSCSSSSSTCGCRSRSGSTHVRRPHRVRSFDLELLRSAVARLDPAVVARRRRHRRAAGPHRDDGRRADDDAHDQDAVEPGAAGADLHVRRRDLRRLALGDPAQHPGHAGVRRVVPRRPRAREAGPRGPRDGHRDVRARCSAR